MLAVSISARSNNLKFRKTTKAIKSGLILKQV